MGRRGVIKPIQRLASLLVAVCLLCVPAVGQPDVGQDVDNAIHTVLAEFHETGGFPGATIGYVTADGRVGSVSVGSAFTESETAMTGDHRMMAGSTGKVLFVALFLQLVDEGALDRDEKISTWLGDEPWFDRLPNAHDITLRMLLNHTSGIPRHVFNPAFLEALTADPQRRWEGAELLEYVFDQDALFLAGQGWSYADTNFVVAGLIVEKLTGESCYNQIYRRIIRPHALWDLVATSSPDVLGLAGGYVDPQNNAFGFERENVVQAGKYVINPQFEWAGGGYASTPLELARLASLLYGGQILSQTMQDEMRTTVEAQLGPGSRYGLGMMFRPATRDGLGDMIGHSGFFPGYLTEMWYAPEHDLAIALQVNTTKMSRTMNPPVMRRVLDECAAILIEEPLQASSP